MPFLVFTGLLLVIVFAAYLLSRGAEVLAEKWGCNIVGSVILALITTLPEYAFVYWASVKGEYRMAIGSAIGACTLLITLGYGLVIVLAISRFSRQPVRYIQLSKATRVDALYLLVTAAVALALIWPDNALSLNEGLVLTALFIGYVVQVFRAGKDSHTLCAPEVSTSRHSMVTAAAQLLIGGGLVYIASEPFVDSMIHIAEMLQVSPAVIAIILGPLASEMPEKLTAYMVVLRNGNNAELSICNFLGSKVNHNSLLLAVMPFVAHFKGHDVVSGLMSPMFLAMTLLTVFVSGMLVKGRLHRWQGWGLMGAYVAAMILAMATS